jgi:polyhydroxyalkanoate synthesis regulator phasin
MLLRAPAGQKLFKEMLDEALTKAGITYDSVLEKMEETYDKAKKNEQTQVMRGITADMYKMLQDSERSKPEGAESSEYDITLLAKQVDQLNPPGELISPSEEEIEYEVVEENR